MRFAASRSSDLANRLLQTERHPNRPRNETISKFSDYAIPHQSHPLSYILPQRPHMKTKTIAVVNSSGRQAASFIRVASAVGYNVRAQLRNLDGIVATEISSLPHVSVFIGELSSSNAKDNYINKELITEVFEGAELAFINTTFWGNEVTIGKYLADAAKKAGVQHYIYSSMPDHSSHDTEWPELPLWSAKSKIESYIMRIGLPATFVYTGIYNNNFTSLPYPLFCMALQQDGSFVWQAPFHPNVKLPWLDAEHDVGPAVLQIIKDGGRNWSGQRIALAYEMLTPLEACRMFSRGIGRPVTYNRGPIEIEVPIPEGYREQLVALESLFNLENEDQEKQPPYFGSFELEKSCPQEALALWEGFRSLEEYAREVFPLEEAANGLVWMNEDNGDNGDENEGDEDELLAMGKRKEEEWLA